MVQIRGHFDGVFGSRASGWVVDLDAPDEILSVEFFSITSDRGLTKLSRVRANRPRNDLHETKITNINHGFEWRIPFSPRGFVLSARIAGYETEIPGSPVTVNPCRVYEGALENVARGVARGWAWAWDPAAAVAVEMFVDARHCGTVAAKLERPDLALAGIGTGRHGFSWLVPDEFADGEPHEITCRIAGTSVWLEGGPLTAAIPPGTHPARIGIDVPIRSHARRPLPGAAKSNWHSLTHDFEETSDAVEVTFFGTADSELVQEALEATKGEFWQPLNRRLTFGSNVVPPSGAEVKRVRVLIPVWGDVYITRLCRFGLPSLLAPNNLPHLARRHQVEVVFLTRRGEQHQFARFPSFREISALTKVAFTDIDDILARCFDPAQDSYATALTYAFFRGIQSVGHAAYDTDFIFWNADFVAADGAFRTLSELISRGVRCTMAPSLRVDLAIEPELAGYIRHGAVLDIGPREWIALASRFPHPSVIAQMVDRSEHRMVDTFHQVYWRIDDTLMVGRVFLMFMLHIRPEQVWDQIYGHCDYTFVPEMVPSGNCHFETCSDNLLMVELQGHDREQNDIVFRDRRIAPHEVAAGVSRWTTREHRLASRQLAVFNSGAIGVDLEPVRRMTDRFMDDVYRRLPGPIWHNGHLHWKESLNALGLGYHEPGPDHPRSHLAAALRWTGYDVDILRESWPDPAGPPDDLFGLELPLDPTFDAGGWLAAAHARYFRAWLDAAAPADPDSLQLDLISGHFHGFGWGIAQRGRLGWTRQVGRDGRGMILVKVAPSCQVRSAVCIVCQEPACVDSLDIYVNGKSPGKVLVEHGAGEARIQFDLDRDVVARAKGYLQFLFCVRAETSHVRGSGGLAFAAVLIRSVGGEPWQRTGKA